MARKVRRLLAVIMTIAMVISLLQGAALAEEEGPAAKVGDTEYDTVTEAITAATAGDTVYLLRDTTENLVIKKNLTLDLNGHTLTGTGAGTVVDVKSTVNTVMVKNGTVTGGGQTSTTTGGGIKTYNVADVTIEDCTVTENKASSGGGIYLIGATDCLIERCNITYNTAATNSGGGVFIEGGETYVIRDCLIYKNSASNSGGGVRLNTSSTKLSNTCTSINTIISENTASFGSGVALGATMYSNYKTTSTFILESGEIYKNTSSSTTTGGAVDLTGNGSRFIMNGGTISENTTKGNGGGICARNWRAATINGGRITGNIAGKMGGAIFVSNPDPEGNNPADVNVLTIGEGVEISGNTASLSGGGICINSDATVNIASGALIYGNTSKSTGGGIYMGSNVTANIAEGALIHNNTSTNSGADICSSGILNLVTVPTSEKLNSDGIQIDGWYYDGYKDGTSTNRWSKSTTKTVIDYDEDGNRTGTHKETSAPYYELCEMPLVAHSEGIIALKAAHCQYLTVTFDANGGSAVASQTVRSGDKATTQETVREFYDFDGWYLNDEKFDFDTPITEDITLTAKWVEAPSVTITPVSLTAYVGGQSANGSHAPKLRFQVTTPEGVSLNDLTFHMNNITTSEDGVTEVTTEVMTRERLDSTTDDTLCLFPLLDAGLGTVTGGAADTEVQYSDYIKLVDETTLSDNIENSTTYSGVYQIQTRAGYKTDWYITAEDTSGNIYLVNLITTDSSGNPATVTIREVSTETNETGTDVVEMYEEPDNYLTSVVTDVADGDETGGGFIAVSGSDTNFTTYYDGDEDLDLGLFGVDDDDDNVFVSEEKANVSLLVDDLLSGYTTESLVQHAESANNEDYSDWSAEAKYLDLVNAADGNIVVTTDSAITIYWPYPEGTNADDYDFQVLHYVGLDRQNSDVYSGGDLTESDAVEVLDAETTGSGIKFETDSFSPFVLLYKEKAAATCILTVQSICTDDDCTDTAPVQTIELNIGDSVDVSTLTIPTWDNHTCTETYYRDAGMIRVIRAAFTISEDMTIYVSWNPGSGGTIGGSVTTQKYILHFNTMGGTPIDDEVYTSGDTHDISDKVTTREGYTFAGWYYEETYQVKITGMVAVFSERTIYAKWEPVSTEPEPEPEPEDAHMLTVVYMCFNGEACESDWPSYDYTFKTGDSVNPYELELTPWDGHRFVDNGMYADRDMKGHYSDSQTIKMDADMIVYALWMEGEDTIDGSVTSKYTLTYVSNGGTEFDPEEYESGTEVALDKAPTREGYTFGGWYTDKDLTEKAESVKMTANTTVYAGWVMTSTTVIAAPQMLESANHYAYINGYTDGTVRPTANITRAETAAIFFRLLTAEVRDGNLTSVNNFADVPADEWYNTAVSTLAALGIIEGRTDTEFAPDDSITRAEFATVCARFDSTIVSEKSKLTDISGHWAESYIKRAEALGWVEGYEDDTFRPDEPITRAEAVTMINRELQRVPESDDDMVDSMIVWPDNPKKEWYYLAMQEASNSHDYNRRAKTGEKWVQLTDAPDWTRYQK